MNDLTYTPPGDNPCKFKYQYDFPFRIEETDTEQLVSWPHVTNPLSDSDPDRSPREPVWLATQISEESKTLQVNV